MTMTLAGLGSGLMGTQDANSSWGMTLWVQGLTLPSSLPPPSGQQKQTISSLQGQGQVDKKLSSLIYHLLKHHLAGPSWEALAVTTACHRWHSRQAAALWPRPGPEWPNKK